MSTVRRVMVVIGMLAACAHAQGTRHFSFRYSFTVKDVPAGERVRIWFPVASSDAFQDVKVSSSHGSLSLKRNHESTFGNEMFFAETTKSKVGELRFEVVYDVVRKEQLTLRMAIPHLASVPISDRDKKEFLAPDLLVPVTGPPADLAAKLAQDKKSVLEQASAIFDYVVDNLKFDVSGTGWGRGDAMYALATRQGDCTEFNSLFVSMARSLGIPARFEMGFAVPAGKTSGEIASYHCWAEVFEPHHGWVPVDPSEAAKHPQQRDYFFGGLDPDRVQFSAGRDLKLNPAQDGPLLNYFAYPYVEVAGKEFDHVSAAFSFTDADAGSGAPR